jgi:site-specific recombinase XerD
MILGRGSAQSDPEIIAEYQQFLLDHHQTSSACCWQRLQAGPRLMQRGIGKPLTQWSEADILAVYHGRSKATWSSYNSFLAFLFLRGYCRATLPLLTTLRLNLARQFRTALEPHRQRLKQTQAELKYTDHPVGTELNLLIALLAVVGKPLEELDRADFEAFREEYQSWYRAKARRKGLPNARLTRLETYLVHWGVIPPAKVVYRHEVYFAQLRPVAIRVAIETYMHWAEVKYKDSTICTQRAALLSFFLWFQAHYPDGVGLDQVTRSVALAYAQELKRHLTAGSYSLHYIGDLYRQVRLFFEFAITERLATSPDRNPFTRNDLPHRSDPVPRYLSDAEIRHLLDYCQHNASLKERTVVITLLHTGIRAAELAALKVSDIVQIQGTWKLHIHQGKGLKDRLIPLTPMGLAVLQVWQAEGWEQINDFLFTYHGKPWKGSGPVCELIRNLGRKLGISDLTPHRFRHTFAVALLNYGIRESALQKLMGHATLNMTLEYARILDHTVEQAFQTAVEQMQVGSHSWVPNFFKTEDYTLFVEGDAISWIRLPHGYCRRNPKLHCESDVKCLLCDRFVASAEDLPKLKAMQERFQSLGLQIKADVVTAQIQRLESQAQKGFISLHPLETHPMTPSSQTSHLNRCSCTTGELNQMDRHYGGRSQQADTPDLYEKTSHVETTPLVSSSLGVK